MTDFDYRCTHKKSSEESVHLRLHCIIHFLIALALGIASLAAHGQTAAATTTTSTIHGHIADQTGALIPGAKVTITTADGKTAGAATADASGAYSVSALTTGNYIVKAEYPGFAPFQSQPIPVAAGQVKRVDIAMAIEVEQQNIVVSDESPQVNVEAGGNANSLVLKDKDLDALSDDPDELSNELSALAGPSAGPNGGQIYIDGFSGGQLPPKSAIREIRINQNPFSAEFDRLGYGRIEILTKPGTDKLHGQAFVQGNDKSFNTGNPFTNTIPSYYSYQFNATVNGPISKTASFFVSAEQRNTENVNAWRIYDAILNQGSGFVDIPQYPVSLLNRRIRDNASARIDWQLGAKNTFTVRYGFWSESEHGDLNNLSLSTASTHESNTDHTVQMSDAYVINDHAVNESRFQFERQNENHYPDSTARTIGVQGDFTGGGYTGQVYRDHATRLEFWNITTLSHGAHAIKFGTRLRDGRDANFTDSNFNGSFSFASSSDYLNMANGLTAGIPYNQLVSEGYGPTSASYTTGGESSLANVFDVALFAQDDWKVNPRLTVSGGVRWEAQNHISDHNDWAPRVSMAYALDGGGNSKKTKTVLRAGYGIFYDRFDVRSLITVNRYNIQNQVVYNNPVCSSTSTSGGPTTSLDQINLSTCANSNESVASTVPVKYEVAPQFHSPYTGQAGASLERQISAGTSATITYLHSFGVHQLVTRNANQALGGTPQTDSGGYIYEYFPEAIFKENQMIASVNARVNKNLNFVGFYTLAFANSDSAGTSGNASNAYDLLQDYGGAAFVSRNMLFAMGNYSGPWGIRFNPFMMAQSGKPYNITLPTDPLNNFYNQRPSYATASTPAANQVVTSFGTLDVAPLPGEKLLPVNLGNGPAAFSFNLRVSRAIGIGPKIEGSGSNANGGMPGGGPPDGGGGGGRRGGPPGGGLGPGGLGGGGRGGAGFGPTATGRKYSLNFSVQALNLFNNIDYGQPTGTIIPTPDSTNGLNGPGRQFGHSTSLAGGMFSSGSAARRVFAQVVFSF
jgi:hypothetical protein